MKLDMRVSLAVLAATMLSVAPPNANGQIDIAPPAGIIRIDLPAHGRVLASHPFLPFDSSVNDQLAEQLGVQGGSQDIQRILKWDEAAQAYVIAEKTLYKRYGRTEVVLIDSKTGVPTTMTIQPGEGFWIENLGTNAHTLYLCGQVMLGDAESLEFGPGLSLFGYPFSSAKDVGAEEVPAEFTAKAAASNPDTAGIIRYRSGGYEALVAGTNGTLVWESDGGHSGPTFSMGEGYVVSRVSTELLTWEVRRPYSDHFSAMALPRIGNIRLLPESKEAHLQIECGGPEALDIFYKDGTPTNALDIGRGWRLADTLPALEQTEGAPAITERTWVDSGVGAGERPALSTVSVRYYLVAQADADMDGDGLPDARELYVHGSDPKTADAEPAVRSLLEQGVEMTSAVTPAAAIEPAAKAEPSDTLLSEPLETIEELQAWFSTEQRAWLPIAPPAPELVFRMTSDKVLPFNMDAFPKDFTSQLAPETRNSVTIYRVTLTEDPVTRETRFLIPLEKDIYSLKPPAGYDPYAYVMAINPDLHSQKYSPVYTDYQMRLWDPARVQVVATLMSTTYMDDYLADEADAQAEADELALADTGGILMMRYDGPAVTNLWITSITRLTNNVQITVVYPATFTNRIDIYQTQDLLGWWWTLAATTPVNTSTNWIEWSDVGIVTNRALGPRFYSAGNADLDTDGDGIPDARETRIYHTDPTNAASYPVSVSGSLFYGGIESGPLYALAVTDANSWSVGRSAKISAPGPYTNSNVATLLSYWFKAFRDVNNNMTYDLWEPWGLYSTSSTAVSGALTGINITLNDVGSIWGALDYGGSETGDVWVVAVTNASSWSTEFSQTISWVQGSSSETGGVFYLTFPTDYSLAGLPSTNIWVKAFMDVNGDGQMQTNEPAGAYLHLPIALSNRVTGINFTLGNDADGDGLFDWVETGTQSFNSPFDTGSSPTNTQSDADGIPDGTEVAARTDPNNSDTNKPSVTLSYPANGSQWRLLP